MCIRDSVEIHDSVGDDNAYIFGARVEQWDELLPSYSPREAARETPGLQRLVDSLINGTFDDGGTGMFSDLRSSLVDGPDADQYYVLGDFASYREVRDKMAEDYKDTEAWAKMAWVNICESGRFSSDRTIDDYAREVWKIKATKI